MNHSKRNSRSCLVDRRPWSQRVGGFTLIELLVVIAIIAMLMAILMPALDLIREYGRAITCKSNLKNLGIVVLMHGNDNGGLFPEVSDPEQAALQVGQALEPYGNGDKISCCPSDREKPTPPGGSYDWRVTHDPKTSLSGVRLDLLRHPNRVIIAGERSTGWHKSGMINVLYADGHVDQVTKEEWFENITTPLEFV